MNRLLEYDSSRRRIWIGGQRCHHGATGIIVATSAFAGLLAEVARGSSIPRPVAPQRPRPLLALALAGGAMMAHDWKDRSIWFERGRGSQR
jgi:hypothetical protein